MEGYPCKTYRLRERSDRERLADRRLTRYREVVSGAEEAICTREITVKINSPLYQTLLSRREVRGFAFDSAILTNILPYSGRNKWQYIAWFARAQGSLR